MPGASLTQAETQTAINLSVLLHDFQRSLCKKFVQGARGLPMLMSYTVDPTSIALVATHTQKQKTHSVLRKGKVLHELLMQRLVLKRSHMVIGGAHLPERPAPLPWECTSHGEQESDRLPCGPITREELKSLPGTSSRASERAPMMRMQPASSGQHWGWMQMCCSTS